MDMLGSGQDKYGSTQAGVAAKRDVRQVMDNPRLASRSDTFFDDNNVKIVKRCFFLAIGDDDHQGNAFSLVMSFNIFDEPGVLKKCEVKAKLANVIVELCPEVLKSITQLIPEFKALFRFKDLYPNKACIERRIELMAPLHWIAELTMGRLRQASDAAILNQMLHWSLLRQQSKTLEEKKKLETYKDRLTIKKLKALDLAVKGLDFDVYIEIQKVGANVTGNPNF